MSEKVRIIPTVFFQYFLYKIFGFESMIYFGKKLEKWQLNKNYLKVGINFSK